MADHSDVILERLMKLHPKVIDLTLDRQHRLHKALGDPQTKLPPVIHVAGTNGKGSAVAFMRSILEAAGLKVHCYTSPHLCHFHERIRLAGQLISEADLSDLLDECETANGGEQITFFEITTAAALLAFSRIPADVVLLEVGLGGRFDSTNVIDHPAVSVITPIDYDHQQFLGDALEGIARTKAGILKRGCPAIIGPQHDDVRDWLEDEARRVGAPLHIFGQDWSAYQEHGRLVYQDEGGLMDLSPPKLPGPHQFANAGTAIAAIRALDRFEISDEAIERGLATVDWPGRMQSLPADRPLFGSLQDADIWLDGGHNPAAGEKLAASMQQLETRDGRPLVMICGMLNTKDATGFFKAFADLAPTVITLPIPGEANGMTAEDLAAHVERAGLTALPVSNLAAAMARVPTTPVRLLFAGSLYFAGHVLREIDLLPK